MTAPSCWARRWWWMVAMRSGEQARSPKGAGDAEHRRREAGDQASRSPEGAGEAEHRGREAGAPSDNSSLFHVGNRALQDRFDGRRVADALEARRRVTAFLPEHVAFIEAAPFFFLATAAEGAVDCSFKGGPPGFVRITGPATLEWPDYDGNSMYLSLGNIARSAAIGMLFIAFDGRS